MRADRRTPDAEAYGPELAYVHEAGFSGFARLAAPALLRILHEHRVEGGLVVDVGCGTGIWAAALLRAGYDVLGIDRSAAMIDRARRHVPAARFEVAPLEEITLPRCAAVTAIGETLSYAQLPLRDFCLRVRDALDAGGVFIFDVAVPGEPYQGQWSGHDWQIFISQSVRGDLLTRRITTFRSVSGTTRRSDEVHELRIYEPEEIAATLQETGFTAQTKRAYGRAQLPAAHLGFVAVRAQGPGPRAQAETTAERSP
ncbi:MAG TPA: class I SAM-dependent methyltransferase [Thermoanaerobaculia bacterium]